VLDIVVVGCAGVRRLWLLVWCSHVRTRILIRNFDIRIDFVLKVMQLMVRAIIEELHAQ
jgi:hypothetical protein